MLESLIMKTEIVVKSEILVYNIIFLIRTSIVLYVDSESDSDIHGWLKIIFKTAKKVYVLIK